MLFKNILKTQKWKIQKVEVPQKSSLWVIIVTELMYIHPEGFPGGIIGKNLSASAGDIRDAGSIPGLGRSPGGGHGYHSSVCLENPKDRGARWATVHGVAKSRT